MSIGAGRAARLGAFRGLAAGLLLLLAALPARAGDLKVTVAGLRSDAGTLMIGLYDSADGFDLAIKHSSEGGLLNDRGRLVGAAMRAAPGARSIIFTQLPPGHYAVIAFHDENDDGRLDESPWGVPLEGYAFSNDAQGLLAAPSFEAASFAVDEEGNDVTLTLIYPKATEPGPPPSQGLE